MVNVISRRRFVKSVLAQGVAVAGLVILGHSSVEMVSAAESVGTIDDQVNYLRSLSYEALAARALAEDGWWGIGTTATLQSFLRVDVTGTFRHQYAPNIDANPGLLRASWLCDDTLEGDSAIRILQVYLGTAKDGIFGANDIRALQSRMGTYVDGVLSGGSPCIREMQRRMNEGWLF